MQHNVLQYTYAERIHESGGKHYIYFRAFNPALNKRDTVRIYIKSYDDPKLIERQGRQLIKSVNKKLDDGWNPFITKESVRFYTNCLVAMEKAYNIFIKNKARRSIQSYTSYYNRLVRWIKETKKEKLYIHEINETVATDYMDFVIGTGVSGTTFNNHRIALIRLFNVLLKRKYIGANPFKSVDSEIEQETPKLAFQPHQRRAYRDYIVEHKPFMYIPSALVFYLGLRPIEISRIKCGHFDLERGIVFVPSEVSKTSKSMYVTIPLRFLVELKSFMKGANPDHYLIAKGRWAPGPHRMSSKNFGHHFSKIRKELQFSKNLYFYSLKDSMADKLIENGFSVKTIRDHMRHTDVSMTNKYLKTHSRNYVYNPKVARDYPEF